MNSDNLSWYEPYSLTAAQTGSEEEIQFLNNNNSVQQYSQTRAKRDAQSREKVEQAKRSRRNGQEGVQAVEATISEDLADGISHKLDAGLKLLCDNELRLIVPSNTLEDSEIYHIETRSFKQLYMRALQDYQLHLMLLDKQNKQQQAMDAINTRLKYDQIRVEDVNIHAQMAGKANSVDKYAEGDYENITERNRKRRRLGDTNIDYGALNRSLAPEKENSVDRDSTEEPEETLRGDSHKEIRSLTGRKTREGPTGTSSEKHWVAGFQVIYHVRCDHGIGTHPVTAFRDLPIPQDLPKPQNSFTFSAERAHFNGADPIFNLQAFMDDDTKNISFVAERTIECSNSTILMAQSGVTVPYVERILVKSTQAKDILRQTAKCHFQVKSNEIQPLGLYLFHHKSILEQYIEEHPAARAHVEGLLQYSERKFTKQFQEATELFAHGKVDQHHILQLFRPNDLVVGLIHGQPTALVVHDWPKMDQHKCTTIHCWSFQYDGFGFARKRTVFSIPPLAKGIKNIPSLACFPLKYATPEMRAKIQANGQKQWDLRKPTQIMYKGWNVKMDQYYPDARFMIDHGTYRKMHENAAAFRFDKPATTFPHDSMPTYIDCEQAPSPTMLMLLSPTIHGFYLNEKKWIHLFIDSVLPVSWNKKAYERLVLPDQTKDLVRALVTVRTSQRGVMQGIGVAGKRTDITGSKGNGLIMLLHGGPGTGKTLTAESVAEIAEMPLYRVTCGDIGTSVDAVEKYLATVLHLGKIWNCVLLLDEADVFLEERSMSDLKRNSLVSVFLRILEYYDGILILTSDRVGMFDEAFKSRIQVALHYENLNRSSRKKIWQNFVEMLEEDDENVNFDELRLHLDELASKELNGRQIRNVLTTARQLAIYRDERLDWEHLVQALSVSSDFTAYLKRMQGHSDDQRARDARLR